MKDNLRHNILYSCTGVPKRAEEPLVPKHCLTYIQSGEIDIHNNGNVVTYVKG